MYFLEIRVLREQHISFDFSLTSFIVDWFYDMKAVSLFHNSQNPLGILLNNSFKSMYRIIYIWTVGQNLTARLQYPENNTELAAGLLSLRDQKMDILSESKIRQNISITHRYVTVNYVFSISVYDPVIVIHLV
mgnify:FL=1